MHCNKYIYLVACERAVIQNVPAILICAAVSENNS